MTGYIEREAFLDAIERGKKYQQDADDIAEMLQNFPAADVRPVVMCRDCKHSEQWYADKSRCFLWHESGIDVFNDGFCNYGEMREES